jgi:hypothetical protein
MSNINLEKLAQLANVSIGTVSKAFSGSKEISEKTKNRIFTLAKKHDCFEKYYGEYAIGFFVRRQQRSVGGRR